MKPLIISNIKIVKIFLLFSSILILGYTATRAFLLSFTWDEAYTYIEFIRKGILFPDKNAVSSPNYHLLLTFLDIKLANLFGTNEFGLRLPSLLGHLLFLSYSARLVVNFENKLFVITSFLILNINPYMLDYFSLARGYGLSLGLIMASIYYLYLFNSDYAKNKAALLSLLLAILAVTANPVLLNYFLVLYCIIILLKCINVSKKKEDKKNRTLVRIIIIHSSIFILIVMLILRLMLNIKETLLNSYGGYTSFWSDTLSETINTNFYGLNNNIYLHWLIKSFILLTISSSFIFGLLNFIKKKEKNISFTTILLLIILLCALSCILQHYLLGIPYLTNRTALFFIVLFNLLLVFFVNNLIKRNKRIILIAFLICTIIITHFIYSINLMYVLDWKTDANTKTIFADFEKIRDGSAKNKRINIYVSPILEEAFNFYTINTKEFNISSSNFERMDYLLLDDQSFSTVKDSVEVIKTYFPSNNVLTKPKFKLGHSRKTVISR